MRYDIFLVKNAANSETLKFEDMEEIVGQVMADSEAEAREVAKETYKQLFGKKFNVKEAAVKKGVWK